MFYVNGTAGTANTGGGGGGGGYPYGGTQTGGSGGSGIVIVRYLTGSQGLIAEITPNITAANTWQTINWDLSSVSDTDKDLISQFVITITNADAPNTFYMDYFEIVQQCADVNGWAE